MKVVVYLYGESESEAQEFNCPGLEYNVETLGNFFAAPEGQRWFAIYGEGVSGAFPIEDVRKVIFKDE